MAATTEKEPCGSVLSAVNEDLLDGRAITNHDQRLLECDDDSDGEDTDGNNCSNLEHDYVDLKIGTNIPTKTVAPIVSLGAFDVICGRDKAAFNHIGNRRFRCTIALELPRFLKAKSRMERAIVSRHIASIVQQNGGRFLVRSNEAIANTRINENRIDSASTPNSVTNLSVWVELSSEQKRSKVGHALRDAVRKSRKRQTTVQELVSSSTLAPTKERQLYKTDPLTDLSPIPYRKITLLETDPTIESSPISFRMSSDTNVQLCQPFSTRLFSTHEEFKSTTIIDPTDQIRQEHASILPSNATIVNNEVPIVSNYLPPVEQLIHRHGQPVPLNNHEFAPSGAMPQHFFSTLPTTITNNVASAIQNQPQQLMLDNVTLVHQRGQQEFLLRQQQQQLSNMQISQSQNAMQHQTRQQQQDQYHRTIQMMMINETQKNRMNSSLFTTNDSYDVPNSISYCGRSPMLGAHLTSHGQFDPLLTQDDRMISNEVDYEHISVHQNDQIMYDTFGKLHNKKDYSG